MSSEWREVLLGDFLRRRIEQPTIKADAVYSRLTMAINGKGVRLRDRVMGRDLGTAKYVARGGDLMISKIDARKGAAAVLPAELDGVIVTGDFLPFVVSRDVADPAFLDLVVRTADFARRCDLISGGTTNRVRLDVKRLPELALMLPPLDLQRRIVDLIGSIDAHIANLEEGQRSLGALEPALLASLFGEGEGRALQDIAQVIDCEHKTAPATDSPHPHGYSVGTAALKNSAVDFARAKPVDCTTMRDWTRRAVPQSGDLILAREAPVGAVALVPASPPVCLGQRTVLIRPNQEEVDPVWLWGYLRSPVVQAKMAEQSWGLTVAHLNVSHIRNIAISCIPEPHDQQRVSRLLTAHLEAAAALGTEIAALVIVRSQLLQALLSREVELPDGYGRLVAGVA